ncbi:HEAT repeat-containing protein 4 isoform 1-T1 [Salvelinus alpinus]
MDLVKRTKSKVGRLQNLKGQQLYRQLLNNATCGLTFSKDVIWEMGSDSIPYSQADFHWLFNASGPLAPSPKPKSTGIKSMKGIPLHPSPQDPAKNRGFRDPPSMLPELQISHLAPLTAKDSFTLPSHQGGLLDSFKRTGLRGVSNVYNCLEEASTGGREDRLKSCHWDEFVLKKLTKTTAQWIVSQQIPNQCQNKTRLQSLLRSQYGSASATDLVNEEPMCEEDFCSYQDLHKQTEKQQALQSSKAETPLPVYYRVQGYSLPPVCSDEPGGMNQTANTVAVKHIETPQPPRLQDSLNPRLGSHVLHTENNFEQEIFSGIAKQVHQRDPRNHDRIIMDNNSEYQKNLQDFFPCGPDKWTKASAATMHNETQGWDFNQINATSVKAWFTSFKFHWVGMRRVEKGTRRWVDLPTTADYATEVGLRPPDYSGKDTEVPRQQAHYNPMAELSSLRYAVEGWRSAWKIKITWQSVTIEGLKRALKDLHYHVRLSAIATCASGAVNRPREKQHPTDAGQYGRVWDIQPVPQELQPLLLLALDDPVKRVQMAAAVCQYAMGTPDSRARVILRNALHQDSAGVGADSWVAAQCLAVEGEHSRPVIQRLLSQHFVSEVHTDNEQSAALLASISSKTTLVRSLLAEELNCANWRTRLLACNTISKLKGPINKDLANKLIYLMWNDWSGNVKQAAAQALGKLGMGRDVHNELRMKLEEGPASWRVEALILIAHLQIMTAKLLPPFLKCFNDNFVAVRKQACLTAAALIMKCSMVLNQLIQLTQNDPAWEVKVVAISALGKIGCLTLTLQDHLLWALHHEEKPQVRIAACKALKILKVKGPELQHLLQERFVLEPHPQVHRHIQGLLKNYGYSIEGDRGMVHKIKDQVQRLCTKSIITDKVLLMEKLEDMYQQQRKYLVNESRPDTTPISQLLQERYNRMKHCPSTVRPTHSSDSSSSSKCTLESSPVNKSSSSAYQDHQHSIM